MKLIKRMHATYLTAAVICVMIATMSCPSAASEDYTNLIKLITNNEDVRINAQDLAFLIVTHGFDATPKGSYVIVKLDEATYSITPNGMKPGLANILIDH